MLEVYNLHRKVCNLHDNPAQRIAKSCAKLTQKTQTKIGAARKPFRVTSKVTIPLKFAVSEG